MARLRAEDQLTELREADLRFSPPEVEGFLNEVMRLNLPKDKLDELALRTEGWITGLQLAVLSIHCDHGFRSVHSVYCRQSSFCTGLFDRRGLGVNQNPFSPSLYTPPS